VHDNELGLFLRRLRETLTPAQVGLPAGRRRRTPGLRRSELATLAAVSVEYVTRLEQGRDRHPSPQVLSALANALHLSSAERLHLYMLAKRDDTGFACRSPQGPSRVVRPGLRGLLDRLDPAAAVVLNPLGEALAWTSGYEELFGPLGMLDGDPPSLTRYVFTDPRAREAFPDWDRVADERVAELKQGPFRSDPAIAALTDELTVTVGDEFERRVQTVPGLASSTGVTRLRHPEHGDLRLAYETLDLLADDGMRIVVHLPADAATTAALEVPRVPDRHLVASSH
jgi:transcriptional regulator with XRE-family HTH domain